MVSFKSITEMIAKLLNIVEVSWYIYIYIYIYNQFNLGWGPFICTWLNTHTVKLKIK